MFTATELRTQIMGLPFDNLTADSTATHILAELDRERGGKLVNPNVDVLRRTVQNNEVRRLVQDVELIVADGAPIVWASRLAGRPLRARVPGASFIWQLCERAAERDRSVFLLGGRDGAADIAAAELTARYPRLKIVGTSCPPLGFEKSSEQMNELIERLRSQAPDLVFCAFGFPKQEFVMAQLQPYFDATWFIGCGASIDFVAGFVRRAPSWVQRLGVEWVYRLYREPVRLFRRYIVDDLPFALRLFGWSFRERVRA